MRMKFLSEGLYRLGKYAFQGTGFALPFFRFQHAVGVADIVIQIEHVVLHHVPGFTAGHPPSVISISTGSPPPFGYGQEAAKMPKIHRLLSPEQD